MDADAFGKCELNRWTILIIIFDLINRVTIRLNDHLILDSYVQYLRV